MSTTIHMGKSRTQTVLGSDGSAIPPGSLLVQMNPASVVSVVVNPADNSVKLTSVAPGTTTLTYSAPGFSSSQDIVTVPAPPSIVVTDGPEV